MFITFNAIKTHITFASQHSLQPLYETKTNFFINATTMLNHFLENVSSYDGNVLLAAIVSLLLVILFVLLLHIYAKWFLAQARQRRARSSMSVSHVLLPARFHHFHSFTFDVDNNANNNINNTTSSKGLEASLIASIPLFVYTSSEYKQGLECVICLSAFEESDVGRSLPKCGHGFHVECIDMWLHSHLNCPICRAPVAGEKKVENLDSTENNESNSVEAVANSELLQIVVEGEPRLERVSDASNCDHEVVGINDSISASASSSLGCSLKRMLSRNRSECKIFPSSTAINVNETED